MKNSQVCQLVTAIYFFLFQKGVDKKGGEKVFQRAFGAAMHEPTGIEILFVQLAKVKKKRDKAGEKPRKSTTCWQS